MPKKSKTSPLAAYITPFVAFMAFLVLIQVVESVGAGSKAWWLATPMYWVFPLQTVVCGYLLARFWKSYVFKPFGSWPVGVLVGLVALALWVSPQTLFGAAPRLHGFDPNVVKVWPSLYWLNLGVRFVRFAVVVPLLEEIFWRGFVMRYLIRESFTAVAFGTFQPLAFVGTAILFMLEHAMVDWPAAIVTGLLYNALAVRTKSLFACVIAHAVTNSGLGIYILHTRQWGFW